MTLSPGRQLASYEIVTPLGKGGMGEVYRAKDTRLDRDVAIKVFPEFMAGDKERVLRFEREAKLLASLNHPNIAAIYGFEASSRAAGFSPRDATEDEGATTSDSSRKLKPAAQDRRVEPALHFLVLEYVEGETLAQRLKRGALPVDEALDFGKHIAEALEAAHEKGIIHRDLKPGNVMIKADGTVKVLDFGLARAMAPEFAVSGTAHDSPTMVAHSPTITADFTRPGVVLGTASYMSPEQARGRPVDKRTDIWSFGVILYELLTGETLFRGETATDSMGAIMHKEPDWSLLPPSTPPTVQLLLRRCLTKDRKRRLHDIADARVELEAAIVDPTSSSLNLTSAALAESRPRSFAFITIVLMIIVAGAAGTAGWLLRPASPAPYVTRLTVTIPEELKLKNWPMPALSRDGRRLALLAERGNRGSQIIVRDLDQPAPRPLTGTEGAFMPMFSPDGEWIAYAQDGKLRKLSIHGGPSIGLCDVNSYRGGAWTSRGTIVFAPNNVGGLSEVSAAGGTPTPFTYLPEDKKARSHRNPYALPDGHGILFTEANDNADWDGTSLWAIAEKGAEPCQIVTRASYGQYISSGHVVFLREGTLMAAPFDLARLELKADPYPVLEGVTDVGGSKPAQFALDERGTLVYMSGSANRERRLVLFDFDGNKEPVGGQIADFRGAAFSPDDSLIAVEIDSPDERRIAILERARDILRVVPTGGTTDRDPVWSPEGKWLAFASQIEGGTWNVYRIRADFTGKPQRLSTSEDRQFPQDWSPDGSLLAVFEIHPESNGDIHMLPFDESGEVSGDPIPYLVAPAWQWGARFSPNGGWVCYASTESGRAEIYVRPTDGAGSAVQVSTNGGLYCVWSPDGQRLYYVVSRSLPTTMNAVTYKVEGSVFTPELPESLFQIEGDDALRGVPDITKNGKHFLMSMPAEEGGESPREPTIILNWAEKVKALVPAGAGR